jgi:AraC family transcriptional regulator
VRIPQENPILTLGYGVEKYGPAGLLASSADRGWSGLSAELRSHNGGIINWKNTQPDTEICVDVHGSGSVITRRGGGIVDRTIAERGTIWLSPAGLQEDLIDISDPVPGILHIYLSPNRFSPDSLGVDLDQSGIASLRYESGFQDPLLAEIAYAILSELQTQTSAGRLLAEALASSLAARLVQHHASPSPPEAGSRTTREGLDRRRLARVLDDIEANLEGDLTLDHLASIAREAARTRQGIIGARRSVFGRYRARAQFFVPSQFHTRISAGHRSDARSISPGFLGLNLPAAESRPLPDRFLPSSLHCQQEMTKPQQPAQSRDGSD